MILEKTICPHCDSDNIRRNGFSKSGKQKYHCLACKRYGTLGAEPKYSEERKQEILNTYFERASLRGVERIFDVDRFTVARWLKKQAALPENQDLSQTLSDVPSNDTLELDEVHSFVQKKLTTDGSGLPLAEQQEK
jgi:transposase-like protein